MYLLYLDESGTHAEAENFVLGGLALFERGAHWVRRDLENVTARFFPDDHAAVVIHATKLRTRDGASIEPPYSRITAAKRSEMLNACYDAITRSPHPTLFATVVNKRGVAPRDPYEVAFEDIVSRFDLMLTRLHHQGSTQRGLVIVAESNYRERLETLGERILRDGAQWGETHNFAEIPLFTPAPRTRLLQAADLVTNAVWGQYEKKLGRDFEKLIPLFDREDERLHGLTHLGIRAADCWCIACYSWRIHRPPQGGE